MDHRYIDDHSVAERYLDHTLPPGERSRFEAHLVDCQECTDRILLAEMFHSRNGHVPLPAEHPANGAAKSSGRLRFVISLTAPQLFAVRAALAALATATLALLAWLVLSSR